MTAEPEKTTFFDDVGGPLPWNAHEGLNDRARCRIWSAYEQERLYRRHDSRWIRSGSGGWSDEREPFDMLSTYMVRRGRCSKAITKENEPSKPNRKNLRTFAEIVACTKKRLPEGRFTGAGIDNAVAEGLARIP